MTVQARHQSDSRSVTSRVPPVARQAGLAGRVASVARVAFSNFFFLVTDQFFS